MPLVPPRDGDTWLGLTDEALPVEDALAWAQVPSCGGVVLFTGTVRDHAEGRPGVSALTYEAYDTEVTSRLEAIVAKARRRWPAVPGPLPTG